MKTLKILFPILFALVLLTGCKKSKEDMDKTYWEAMAKLEQNDISGLSMLEELGEDGHLLSQQTLAKFYLMEVNYPKAKYWLEKAAAQGDSESEQLLREMQSNGY